MEATENGGGNAAHSADAAQTEFKAPEGKVLIDTAEYERFRQNSERVRGMQPYWETGSKHGFKKPEDFEPIGKLQAALKQKGMGLDQLMGLISGPEQTAQPQGGVDLSAIEKSIGEKYVPADKFESELARRDALYEHKNALRSEQELVSKSLSELLGDSPTARDKYLIETALKAELADPDNRTLYPEGHPLHSEHYFPMDEAAVKKLIGAVKKKLAIEDGTEAVKTADAALKGKVSTPAGSTNKTPNKAPKPGDEQRRPGNLPPRAAVEAEFKKRQAARGGGPVSSIGG